MYTALIPKLINLSMLFSPNDILTDLVIIAFLIASVIIGIWYIIGAIFNNDKVKAGAKGEFYQLVGTAIMIGILLAALYTFAFAFSYVVLPYQNSFSNACTNFKGSAQLYAVQQTLSTPVATYKNICSVIESSQGNSATITDLIDLPMADAIVVTSSLAEQAAEDFNMSFYFDGWLGFLSELQYIPFIAGKGIGTNKLSIGGGVGEKPYAGVDLIYKGFGILSVLLMTEVAAFIGQLIFENIFLFIWPYLLFLGIIFRTTIFTRKLGGLLIAIAIGAIAVYPALLIGELAVSSNMAAPSATQTSAAQAASPAAQTINFCNNGYSYTENFSKMPSIGSIATACSCYPTHGLFGEEFLAVSGSLAGVGIVGNGASYFNIGGFNLACTGHSSSFLISYSTIGVTETTLFNLITAYGFIGVIGYFVPIINILITINAIIGFSSILGGDTSLAGLARLIG